MDNTVYLKFTRLVKWPLSDKSSDITAGSSPSLFFCRNRNWEISFHRWRNGTVLGLPWWPQWPCPELLAEEALDFHPYLSHEHLLLSLYGSLSWPHRARSGSAHCVMAPSVKSCNEDAQAVPPKSAWVAVDTVLRPEVRATNFNKVSAHWRPRLSPLSSLSFPLWLSILMWEV